MCKLHIQNNIKYEHLHLLGKYNFSKSNSVYNIFTNVKMVHCIRYIIKIKIVQKKNITVQ